MENQNSKTENIVFKYPEPSFYFNVFMRAGILLLVVLICHVVISEIGFSAALPLVIPVAVIIGLLIYSTLAHFKTIAVHSNFIEIKYTFEVKKKLVLSLQNCTGYFPYKRTISQFSGRMATDDKMYIWGVVLKFQNSFLLPIESKFSQKEKLDDVLKIMKDKQLRNYSPNNHEDYYGLVTELWASTTNIKKLAQRYFISK